MNRLDLARKEFEKAKAWAEDDLMLQLIEAIVGLASGVDNYSNPQGFYNEQAANPTLTSSHLVVAKGLAHLLKGELPEAQADFVEALRLNPTEESALAGKSIAEWLNGDSTKSEATFK
jgi:coatomer protein complex subunit epsilon